MIQFSIMVCKNNMKMSLLSVLMVWMVSSQINTCYTKCKEGGCIDGSSYQCSECNLGLLLVGTDCVQKGGQADIISMYDAVDGQTLSGLDPSDRTVTCTANNSGILSTMTYVNETLSSTSKYSVSVADQQLPTTNHQFIKILFNAILFNNKADPRIKVKILNENDVELVDRTIQPNLQFPVTCNSQLASSPFYVYEAISDSSRRITIEVDTVDGGDELGVASVLLYSGSCYPSCGTCVGSLPEECLSCMGFLHYDDATQGCTTCPDGFYRDSYQCLACPYHCRTCSSSSSCSSCQPTLQYAHSTGCVLQNQVFSELGDLHFMETAGWASDELGQDVMSKCGSYSLVGGLLKGRGRSIISKHFTGLNIHSQVWLKFLLILIDQEENDLYELEVMVDEVLVTTFQIFINSTVQNTSECGGSKMEYAQVMFVGDIPHSGDEITIGLSGGLNYFGIRDFTLGVVNLTNTDNCYSVDDASLCQACNFGYELSGNSTCEECPAGYYQFDGQCQICPIFCQTCAISAGQQLQCTSCDDPLKDSADGDECVDIEKSLYNIEIFPKLPTIVNNQWKFYPKLQDDGETTCGNDTILGSTEIVYRSLWMKRMFTSLPKHRGAKVHFHFYQIDDYDDPFNTVYFLINGKKQEYEIAYNKRQICGNSSLDAIQKVILEDPAHQSDTLIIEVHGNRTKFGINNVLLFLKSCTDCSNSVTYSVEAMPIYSIDSPPIKGYQSKIIFQEPIETITNISNLIGVEIVREEDLEAEVGNASGLFEEGILFEDQLISNRQLVQLRNLNRNHLGETLLTEILRPGAIYAEKENINKPISTEKSETAFPRYDEINEEDSQRRHNIKNLQNLFRGIAILAMFIGLLSFFLDLSFAFDDLFVLCQLIFVHVFIQGAYTPATFKIPVSGMQVVQFMLWLPFDARVEIEKGIIPDDHYQRSPIIYEQFYQDVSFVRTIYHTILFFVVMCIFYAILVVCIIGGDPKRPKHSTPYKYYQRTYERTFVFIDKVVRFAYFTIVWACALQFTWFENLPQSFHIWNTIILIVFFIFVVLYPIIAFVYLRRRENSLTVSTYKNLYEGIRIESDDNKLIYYLVQYFKWLVIGLLIGLLHNVNPLATLIPLAFIFLFDGLAVLFWKPYILVFAEEKFGNCFTQNYLKVYWVSFIIQNFLFVILQIVLIIAYATRETADTESYFRTGYAACVFVILLLFNGLVRWAWGLVFAAEECYDSVKAEGMKVSNVQENEPIKEQPVIPATNTMLRSNVRRTSIDYQLNK